MSFGLISQHFRPHIGPPDSNVMTLTALEAIASSSGKKHVQISFSFFTGLYFSIVCYSIFSPDLPESEASFAITGGGISDAKE